MTRDEWTALTSYVDAWWPGEFDEHAEEAWWPVLAGYDRDDVFAALSASLHTSPKWRPAAGEVVALLEPHAPAAPSEVEAYAVLFGPGGIVRRSITSGDADALIMADGAHPYLGAFCRAFGLERLRMLPVEDPDYGELERTRLAVRWRDHVRICDERVAAGKSLETMGRRGELGRLDPLRALNGGPPA